MAITRITGSKWLVDLSVNTAKVADLAITTAKLADTGVTTPKVADAAITAVKIDATDDYTFNSATIGENGETVIASDGTITSKGGNLIIQNTDGSTDILKVDSSTETITTSKDVVISGDLTVNGTTTTVNSETLDVTDANITVGKDGTVSTADGSGITVDITDGTSGSLVYKAASPTKWAAGDIGAEINVVGETGTATLFDKTYDLVGDDIQGESDIEPALRKLDENAGAVKDTFYGDTTSGEVSSDGLTVTITDATEINAVYASGVRLSLGSDNDYTVDDSAVITLAEALEGNIVVEFLK